MRWLLLKDLQILRRSPLQAVLLVLYPVLIAVLVGFAISRGPETPRVAFLNEVPEDARISLSGTKLPSANVQQRICDKVECVPVHSRDEAVSKVESGDVLAALILPEDLINQINSLSTLAPGTPKVEVIVNESNPLKAGATEDKITALLAQANLAIAKRIAVEGSKYLDLVIKGGDLPILGGAVHILGLQASAHILEALEPALPKGPLRQALGQVTEFSNEAGENLDIAGPLIERLAQPIEVHKVDVGGSSPRSKPSPSPPPRPSPWPSSRCCSSPGRWRSSARRTPTRGSSAGSSRRRRCSARRSCSGSSLGLVVTVLMLAGLAIFVPLEWSRFALWIVAILLGGGASAAAGAALGAAAREVRAVSLLAFMVTLPVAFLSLVPAGTVGHGLYDVIKVIAAIFPFKPALEALTAALESGNGALGGPLLHLAILIVAYGLIARVALRRFARV